METAKKTSEKTSPLLAMELSKLAAKIEHGIVEQKFNTCIAGMMELVNLWKNNDLVMSSEDVAKFAQIMSPFAPQTAQAVWELCSNAVTQYHSVSDSGWPSFDDVAEIADLLVTIAVQVNGKLRSVLQVPSNKSQIESEVVKLALADEKVKKWLSGEPKKIIFVQGRLINYVL